MKPNRLPGHTLPNEGRLYVDGYRTQQGPAVCSCGWQSVELPSDNGRRVAHYDHKNDIRSELGLARMDAQAAKEDENR